MLNLKCIRDRYAVCVLEAVKNAIVIFNVTGKFEDILCYSKNKHKKNVEKRLSTRHTPGPLELIAKQAFI